MRRWSQRQVRRWRQTQQNGEHPPVDRSRQDIQVCLNSSETRQQSEAELFSPLKPRYLSRSPSHYLSHSPSLSLSLPHLSLPRISIFHSLSAHLSLSPISLSLSFLSFPLHPSPSLRLSFSLSPSLSFSLAGSPLLSLSLSLCLSPPVTLSSHLPSSLAPSLSHLSPSLFL